MKKQILALCLFLIFLFPQSAFAVSITINNSPGSVSSDSFNVDVSVIGASTGQNYLRAELYKDGTSNYFGETYNGSTWYGGSSGTSYFPINVVDSKTTASATLQIRIGTPTATEFPGAGTYKLKIKRYTSSGNAASSDDGPPVDLNVNYQAPVTPTPTPKASSSSSSSTKTTTTTVKTSSPTPTKIITSSSNTNLATNSNSNTASQTVNNSDKIATDFAKVQNAQVSPIEKGQKVEVLGARAHDFSFIPLLLGLILIGGGAGLLIYKNWDLVKTWIQKE